MSQSQTQVSRPGLTKHTLAQVANAAVLTIAIAVLLGWGLEMPALARMLPGTPPMYPLTAVGLLAASIAWLVLESGVSRWRSIVAGVLALAILSTGVAVTTEYLFGFHWGFHQVLFRQALERQSVPNAGLIAPNTAINFILVGSALLLFLKRQEGATRLAQFLTVVAGVIALFGVCGYAYAEPHLYRIANFSAMSLPTSVAFLLLCTALVAFRASPRPGFGILLGVVFLLTVVGINAVVAFCATQNLIVKNRSVDHARMVTSELDAALAALLNAETGERGYLYTGERKYLEPYNLGEPEVERHLNQLANLIADNPIQRYYLARLTASVRDAMSFFQQVIALEAAGESQAARQAVLSGAGKIKMDAVRGALDDMKVEESKLLAVRAADAQRSERYLLLAIPASHVFTAILLAFAGFLVRRDLRKRMETERIFRELAEREHAARRETEAAHERTESVLSGISEMFIRLDRDWRITYVNEQAVRFTGKPRTALVGAEYWSAFPETLGTRVEEAYRRSMETQQPEAFEVFNAVLQKWFSVHLYPSPAALTVFAQDITGLKEAQDALVRTEKLAAVGRMASTVAHEINNPLEAVTNLIWIAQNDPSASESVRTRLGIADDELRRVAHIAKQTLGFYRDASQQKMVKMREVMDSVLGLYASRIASKQISVRTRYEDCEVLGYGGELRQLFANLCGNAVDAVQSRGTLALKVSHAHAWRGANEPGIRITIADDGCGIAAENLKSLFKPFFTTKESTGTGLGLWLAKQIAEKHGGWITVRSATRPSRHYTVFSVFLPLRDEAHLQDFAVAS